ncbi:septum formation protein Maf [Clostridia bacterium]|nr:septum formation protein Maf [Clostridia bacterium]
MRKIILASGSPRRSELLTQVGLEHKIIRSNVREDYDEYLLPQEIVMTLALRKARDVAKKTTEANALIIAADTVVVFKGEVLGKPKNAKNSKEMLEKLSDNRHEVLTGIALIRLEDGKTIVDYESTTVEFRHITRKEITEYSRKNESRDKAGGYAIQGAAAKFVSNIEGEYTNVVGLPLCRIAEILNEQFGE